MGRPDVAVLQAPLAGTSKYGKLGFEFGLMWPYVQAALVQDIDHFLGLTQAEFQAQRFRPGILLSMLCILLWCLG